MKIAILTANLGKFDKPITSIPQEGLLPGTELAQHMFDDSNFPPIAGLTPRLQYRIPKMFGWQMFPGYDIYIWLDGSMSLQHPNAVQWLLNQLGDADMAFFRHPWRKTIEEEVNHIEDYLQKGNEYITSRYGGGLHKEQLAVIKKDLNYVDRDLFASTAFIYRINHFSALTLKEWWYYQSRYFTCDQVPLPFVIHSTGTKVNKIHENIFKNEYISLVSHHK